MPVPRTFKDFVLADLERAQRLKLRIRDEIDPQFRIATPEGDLWVAMTLPDDLGERNRCMGLMSDFMAMKMAVGFTLAAELKEPDAVSVVGVLRRETLGAVSLIRRNPVRFSPVRWLSPAEIGDEVLGLLPRGRREFTAARLTQVASYFGPNGRFSAVAIVNE